MSRLYGYPDMGRTGLGHSLLAWGRCELWCRDTGATMLAPRWLRPRIGPFVRGERDKRNYFLLFHKGDLVGEPRRAYLLATANKLYAELDLPYADATFNRPTVVVFRNALADNERKMFHLVAQHGQYLHERLRRITRPRFIPRRSAPFIAVHVRMGDFGTASIEQLRAGCRNSRLPIEWYRDAVEQLTSQVADQPVEVFSDGTDEALAPLLALPRVRRAARQPSVTDILSIAQSSALIASGSGFSLWGSFLGGVPRICFPGQGPARGCQTIEHEVEWHGGSFPQTLIEQIDRPR